MTGTGALWWLLGEQGAIHGIAHPFAEGIEQ
jgi:hypothetical protein